MAGVPLELGLPVSPEVPPSVVTSQAINNLSPNVDLDIGIWEIPHQPLKENELLVIKFGKERLTIEEKYVLQVVDQAITGKYTDAESEILNILEGSDMNNTLEKFRKLYQRGKRENNKLFTMTPAYVWERFSRIDPLRGKRSKGVIFDAEIDDIAA